MDSKIIKYILLFVFIFSFEAKSIEFNGKFIQGHFILGKTDPGAKIKIDDKEIKVTEDGDFVFGLDRDRKNDVVILKTLNGNKTKIVKRIIKREYKIQRIDGLEPKKVTPPKEVYARIKKENKLIVRAREINSNLKFFKNKFIAPLDDAIITGIYGSQRILNGKPRSPHYGIDLAGKLGTPIKAMANGVVTLAENDLYYTGATLIFDHGHGISTLYMHMNKIFVEEGDIVKQGDIIGTVGSSGRSTGPHLDIRLNWFGIKLDPSTIIDIKL